MSTKKSPRKTLTVWLLVFFVAVLLLYAVQSKKGSQGHEEFSAFLKHLEEGSVAEVVMEGRNQLQVSLHNDYRYTTIGVADDELVKKISERGVLVNYAEGSGGAIWAWLPMVVLVLIIVIFFVSLKKQQGGAGNIFNLGKSRARLVDDKAVTFADVGGAEEAKDHFSDIIDFLKQPKRWIEAGVRLPRGVLLIGPPGCGKTLIARAVAGEAGVPFFTVSASEFVEMFVGVGAARVRDMFDKAKKEAPAIIFIDELDAVGRRRGSGIGMAHDEREQTLNQILVSLDGFERNDEVVVIAATNRPDVLDSALLRPGRFDLRINIAAPDPQARLETLKIHTRNKPLAADVSLESVTEKTTGCTGADLENLTNEAALLAVRRVRGDERQSAVIAKDDFDRVLESSARKQKDFSKLDSVLIDSTTQLAQPTGKVVVRLTTRDGAVVEGDLIWADAGFLKVRKADNEQVLIPKMQVKQVEALAGTEMAEFGDVLGHQWTHGVPQAL